MVTMETSMRTTRCGTCSIQPSRRRYGASALALGGEGAAGEVRLPQADGSNGAEEKRKRRQKRLSFSLELIEHYGKKSLFCKRPPNPLCGAQNAARARDLCSGKTSGDFFLFLAALNPVRAGLPRWPMRCIRPWSPEYIRASKLSMCVNGLGR